MTRFLVFIAVGCFCQCCYSFLPAPITSSTVSETHRSISTSAVLNVASDLLKATPNPDDPASTSRITQLHNLTAKSLLEAYYGTTVQRSVLRFGEAINSITKANEDIDFNDKAKRRAALHFDSETFASGQNVLIGKRRLAEKAIMNGDYETARMYAGELLHTLQDFYSHSNWVEMGMTAPNIVLAQEGMTIPNVAMPQQSTCADCSSTCTDNILKGINDNFILTSGFYRDIISNQWQVDETGKEIIKIERYRKCSHGGISDSSSSINARGGINKDSDSSILSPTGNGYRHYTAAQLARNASIKVLNDLRATVGDMHFLNFLNLDPQLQSIAYVIDTTGSMSEELPQIQASISTIRKDLLDYKAILGSGVQLQYILVPFNDPDPGYITKTFDVEVFLSDIANLSAIGGGDCPEPSIRALIRALEASETNSPIYVFTDASASDEYLLSRAASLIAAKKDIVTYITQNGCGYTKKRSAVSKRQTLSNPYLYLASISGGQVLHVEAVDLSKVSTLVIQSITGNPATIFYNSGPGNAANASVYNFYVDVTCNNVVISITGTNLYVDVESPNGTMLYSNTTISTSTTFIGTLISTDSKFQYGIWTIRIRSYGTFTTQVAALTNTDYIYSLYYYHNLSTLLYGFKAIEGYPLQGKPLMILVQPDAYTDSSAAVLSSIRLLSDSSGLQLDSQPLNNTGDGTYNGLLTVPTQPFRIQVIGKDSGGHYLSRIGSTILSSDIELSLGDGFSPLILLPGERKEGTVFLHNNGSSDSFGISVTTDNSTKFIFSTVPNVSVSNLETVNFTISVLAPLNATDGVSTIVIVTATSSSRSDTVKFVAVFALTPIFLNDTNENSTSITTTENEVKENHTSIITTEYEVKEYHLSAIIGGSIGGGVLIILITALGISFCICWHDEVTVEIKCST